MSYSCSWPNTRRDICEHAIPYSFVTSLALVLLVFGILGRVQVPHFQNMSRLTSSCLMTGGFALIIAEGIILCINSASQKADKPNADKANADKPNNVPELDLNRRLPIDLSKKAPKRTRSAESLNPGKPLPLPRSASSDSLSLSSLTRV